MKFTSDIDIDFGNRDLILDQIKYVSASIRTNSDIRKHNTGIYVTDIPYDPINGMASIDYNEAEKRGYMKLDFLNVSIYKMIRDENHLLELMREPNWQLLQDQSFVENLIHLGNHYNVLCSMPEPVNSIPRLAMFLAVIRPGKRHLIGKSWKEISESIWDKSEDGYHFKHSHSCAYAHLVVVHMNILCEQERKSM
jgi:hypothetical protein